MANTSYSYVYFPNFGHNHSMQMLINSLQTFYLPEQLLLSQSSNRTDFKNDSLARHSYRTAGVDFLRAPDLSCPVKLCPLKYRAVSVRSFSATVKRAKSCPLLQQEVFHPRIWRPTSNCDLRFAVAQPHSPDLQPRSPAIKPGQRPAAQASQGALKSAGPQIFNIFFFSRGLCEIQLIS